MLREEWLSAILAPMEQIIFQAIFGLTRQSNWLDLLGIMLAVYLGYIMIAAVLIALFTHPDRRRRLANLLFIVISILLARGVIAEVIRFFYFRPRPFVTLDIEPLITSAATAALPSGHATFFFALAVAASITLGKRFGGWLMVAAGFIALARVFVGVHWLSDVVLGAAIGIFSPFVLQYVLRKTAAAPRSSEPAVSQ